MKENIWIFSLLLLIVAFFFDGEILKFINLVRIDILIPFMKFISYFLVVGAILIAYAILLRDERKIILLALTVILAFVVSNIIKLIIMRERPLDAIVLETDYSFPSSHAAVIFSTIALMCKEVSKMKWLFIGIALLITFSRLYLGVHYTSDLVFGGFLGYGIGLIILHRKALTNKIKIYLSMRHS